MPYHASHNYLAVVSPVRESDGVIRSTCALQIWVFLEFPCNQNIARLIAIFIGLALSSIHCHCRVGMAPPSVLRVSSPPLSMSVGWTHVCVPCQARHGTQARHKLLFVCCFSF